MAGWRLLATDLGIHPADLLRQAHLPEEILLRDSVYLATEEYYRFWSALEKMVDDPTLPIRIGEALRSEGFDPPLFAALCSPDLNTALQRISTYKKLICPMTLKVEVGQDTRVEIQLPPTVQPLPVGLVATELIFLVQMGRMATRHTIKPLKVTTPVMFEPSDAFEAYFGVRVVQGEAHSVTFSQADGTRPFLTANDSMWEFFEPELRKRLADLDNSSPISDRVQAVLRETLPAGDATIETVADRLGYSVRSLQRKLREEGASFRLMLHWTRAALADYYLKSTSLSGAEISYLLGYDDPASFHRAFRDWNNFTPGQMRRGEAVD